VSDDFTAWLRKRIQERRYLAEHVIELGNAAEWTELSSGVLMTIAPDASQDTWDGVHPIGDSSLTRLMEANDPRDTIARCEAELAILDEHAPSQGYHQPEGDLTMICVMCADDQMYGYPYPCKTVRLLGSGYTSRPGYRGEEWAP
jgi:hypothetical protein